MDHDDLEPQFEVTDDELRQLKEGLSEKFPKDWQYMSDDYILSVASKPYSKDTSIRRPLEVGFFRFWLRISFAYHFEHPHYSTTFISVCEHLS